ncbi:AraC family transcriptional regulator [Paenibacillus sp. FSL H8-0537]|uniref:helix-turn-helix transcriptional regulator n=1 Tax=Paenibacillus sp. FSL H8-0537 TaxID=2921399 RepID=UPI003101AC90
MLKIQFYSLISQQSITMNRKSQRPLQLIHGDQIMLLLALNPMELMQEQQSISLGKEELLLASGPLCIVPQHEPTISYKGIVCNIEGERTDEEAEWTISIIKPADRELAQQLLKNPVQTEQDIHVLERYLQLFIQSNPKRKVCAMESARRSSEQIDKRISFVYRYMLLHYEKPLTLHDLSKLVGCHPVYLSSVYTRVYQVSPMQHLQQIRMRKASVFVRSTNMKMKEIAHSIGYVSSSQFGSIYKRYYGVSPNRDRAATMMNTSWIEPYY